MNSVFLLFGLFISVSFAQVQYTQASEYRSYDGYGNNPSHPYWGNANTPLVRFAGINGYEDGKSQMRSDLPSTRDISNAIFGLVNNYNPPNPLGLTDFVTYWGQFLDHDLGLTPSNSSEPSPITVPLGDQWFDPASNGNATISFSRSIKVDGTGITNTREQPNLITSFIDGSMIYGSDAARATALRLFVDGKLNTSAGNLPPRLEDRPFFMANDAHVVPDSELFFVGDVRGNENPGLTSLHTIFLREHNRWCDVLKAFNSSWDDETLYQEARRRVIAILQRITFVEYLPVTLGESLPHYTGFNSSVNPGILTEFSTGAFRYGHTEVNSWLWRLGSDNTEILQGHLRLKSYFFNPNGLDQGIEPLLRGMANQIQGAVDTFFIEDLRNYLFGSPGMGGMDLTAINTKRARDHGLPGFNTLRNIFGLPSYNNFSEVTSNVTVANALANVYQNVEDCDIYVCGLAENKMSGSNIGYTFQAIVKEQYRRLRDGDRFWYENNQFSQSELSEISLSTLAAVISRNTNSMANLQCFVMASPDGCVYGQNYTGGGSTTGVLNCVGCDFIVTVALKTPFSPIYNSGFEYGYIINGIETPQLTVERGRTYVFRVDAGCNHRLYISSDPVGNGAGYVDDGVQNNDACEGSNLYFTPNNVHPDLLYYQCGIHDTMGWKINVTGAGPLTTGMIPSATTGGSTTDQESQVNSNALVLKISILFSIIVVFLL